MFFPVKPTSDFARSISSLAFRSHAASAIFLSRFSSPRGFLLRSSARPRLWVCLETGLRRFHFRLGSGERLGRGLQPCFRLGQLLLDWGVPVEADSNSPALRLAKGAATSACVVRSLRLGLIGSGPGIRRKLPGVLSG
ncbi:MAG: hypothetical protein Ct9H300mP7_6710 [Verrucomicrobiota bacterium]|nr:MAG: hypothetical protein Ct9H300mP7_6710 [Verrucomicrobiota bacterium]